MPFEAGSVVAKFVADISGFKSSVQQVQNDTKNLKSNFTNIGSAVSSMAGVFGVALGAAGLAGFIKSSITAFEEQQRVMTQTNAVIKSTGNAAGYTANQIADMAKEIQNSTPISDEAAQTGMNMLLTFTNIGHDVFPQVTQATLDMATAMNGGLTPSAETLAQTAIQVGKAMQDPILGVTALRRVGVNFNETQQAMILQGARASGVNTDLGGWGYSSGGVVNRDAWERGARFEFTSTLSTTQYRTIQFEEVRTTQGTRVINTTIIPWIRSRCVAFHSKNMRPNTAYYAFFDGVNVTNYVKRANVLRLANNASGTASGFFTEELRNSYGSPDFLYHYDNYSPNSVTFKGIDCLLSFANGVGMVVDAGVMSRTYNS
jgi:hypothetical protein